MEQADPLSAALQAAQHFARKAIPAIVVDTEEGAVRLGLASHLAQTLQADLLSIEDLKAETLSTLVREVSLDRHKGINLDEHNEVSLEGRKGVNK